MATPVKMQNVYYLKKYFISNSFKISFCSVHDGIARSEIKVSAGSEVLSSYCMARHQGCWHNNPNLEVPKADKSECGPHCKIWCAARYNDHDADNRANKGEFTYYTKGFPGYSVTGNCGKQWSSRLNQEVSAQVKLWGDAMHELQLPL